MGLLSKKLPYPRDSFLLSACQFTASSQGNGKFMEFIHLHGADSISQKSPKFYLLTHYFTYLPKYICQFVVLPIRQSFPQPKFSTIQYKPIHLSIVLGLTMHTAMLHISCLISAPSHHQYALLHSLTETTHKKY